MKNYSSPVLFIIFNRPETTKEVFGQIKKAQPRQLFIAADGPRVDQPTDHNLCKQARSIIDQVDWPCELQTLLHKENLGCKFGPITAINWFFSHVEQGIILEDDCVPDLSFFQYCSELLERYKDNKKILSINGHNLGYISKYDYSYSFTRYMNMWGWATWRRSLDLIDYELEDWETINKNWFLYTSLRSSVFDFDWKWVKNWRNTYVDLLEKEVDAWDYYWIYAGFRHRLLSVVPHKNLINNIGFNANATHTKSKDHLIGKTINEKMNSPLVHPKRISRNTDYEENYVKKIWQSYERKPFFYQLWAFYDDVIKSLISRS